jgi:putative phosphoribosyl transferase
MHSYLPDDALAMGAIASGDITIINHAITSELTNPAEVLKPLIESEQMKVKKRELLYRNHRPPLNVLRQHAILVDDGLATGATMRAAAQAVRLLGATRCVVASPVGSVRACRVLGKEVDQLVCPLVPADFSTVADYYDNFADLTDDEVRELLSQDPRAAESPIIPA